jgi:hypothetical protein
MQNDIPIYELFRDYVKHEDELINNRLSWLLTIHGFLYATYGFTIQKKLEVAQHMADVLQGKSSEYVNCYVSLGNLGITIAQVEFFLIFLVLIGFFISVVGLLSIRAATLASHNLNNIFDGQYSDARIGVQPPHPNWFRRLWPPRPRFSSTQPFGAENLFVLSDGHRHFFSPGIGGGGHSQLVSVGIISPIAIPIILMVSWVAAGSYSAVNIYKNRHYIFNYFVVGGTSCQHFDLLYGTHAPQWQDPCPFCLPF